MDPSTKEVVDLDALTEKGVYVKLNGKQFLISPPDLFSLFEIRKLGKRLESSGNLKADSSDEEFDNLASSLKKALTTIIPGIEDEKISLAQIAKILEIVNELSTPSELPNLAKADIEVTDSEKKIS